MIICPNFSNPEVAREFEELKLATSEQAAYHIWSLNNGNIIDRAPNGAPSKLFLTLLEHYGGDRVKAILAKAKVYGTSFLNWFGDWINDPANSSKVVDENGEPLVVYHGTTSDFTTFSKEKLGTFTGTKSAKLAFFTASNEELAKDIYAQMESNEHFYQRMLKVDLNFTKEDIGIGPEEDSITDKIYSEWFEYYNDLESEYKDVLQELEKRRTTRKQIFSETISKAEEWVTDLGLEDYIKQGYAISDTQRKEYEEGKAITISKEIDVLDDINKIEAAKALNTKRSREFAEKYETLDRELKEALEKAEIEDKNSYRNRVKALFLNIRNPKVDSDYGNHYRAETYAKRIQDAINNSNDGGIIKDTRDPYRTDIYYFFEPNQAKSATDNKGTFSRENDDIYLAISEEPNTRERTDEETSIVQQLIAHLRSIGIPVHNRQEMIQKFGSSVFSRLNDDTQMFIGKKARTQFEQQLRKARPDMSDAEIKSTLDFLHSLEDNKENTAYIKTAIRWIANRSLTLPQDHTKAYQAFELARKKHLDLLKYPTLGALITAPEMQPKEKEKPKFDPDEAKTFSNKRTVTTKGGRVFTVYDVENTEEGQREVCKALAAHYKMSPWCLSTFTATGEPTESAKRYWDVYSSLPRKIAYENGKPVAFSSDNLDRTGHARRMTDSEYEEYKNLRDKVSQYEHQRPKLTRRNSNDAENIKKQQEQFDKDNPEYIVLKRELDDILNRIRSSDENGIYIYDRISKEKEAWWDMEDRYPQDSLSDSIVSDSERTRRFIDVDEPFEPDPNINEDLPWFITPNGEIYGFVDNNGEIYLDETVISSEHPIHEFTHLWDKIVQQRNKKLWNRGVKLMKQTSLWKQIEESKQYGLKWKSMSGMTKSHLDDLIASEVHARLTGENGALIIENIAKEKGSSNIVEKLKNWISEFWQYLKETFGEWSEQDLNNLSIEDFVNMPIRDFVKFDTSLQVEEATTFVENELTEVQLQIKLLEDQIKSITKEIEKINDNRKQLLEHFILDDGKSPFVLKNTFGRNINIDIQIKGDVVNSDFLFPSDWFFGLIYDTKPTVESERDLFSIEKEIKLLEDELKRGTWYSYELDEYFKIDEGSINFRKERLKNLQKQKLEILELLEDNNLKSQKVLKEYRQVLYNLLFYISTKGIKHVYSNNFDDSFPDYVDRAIYRTNTTISNKIFNNIETILGEDALLFFKLKLGKDVLGYDQDFEPQANIRVDVEGLLDYLKEKYNVAVNNDIIHNIKDVVSGKYRRSEADINIGKTNQKLLGKLISELEQKLSNVLQQQQILQQREKELRNLSKEQQLNLSSLSKAGEELMKKCGG